MSGVSVDYKQLETLKSFASFFDFVQNPQKFKDLIEQSMITIEKMESVIHTHTTIDNAFHYAQAQRQEADLLVKNAKESYEKQMKEIKELREKQNKMLEDVEQKAKAMDEYARKVRAEKEVFEKDRKEFEPRKKELEAFEASLKILSEGLKIREKELKEKAEKVKALLG